MLECSELVTSLWKHGHPSDTEEDPAVGLSSEDEAAGLEPEPRVARHRFGGPASVGAPAPIEVHLKVHPAGDEVLVKKRALKWVKQQVSALLHVGKTFPRVLRLGRLPRSPYQIPAVPREAKDCPVCQQSFKTHHCLMVHMGVHRGEKFPCSKCGKVLANRRMHARHTASCVQGKKVECPDCGKQYVSTQGLKQHQKAKHGADAPDEGTYVCPYCGKQYHIKKSWAEHKPYCEANPNRKGPYFCRVTGCPAADHPFNCIQKPELPHVKHPWLEGMADLNWIGCWNLGE